MRHYPEFYVVTFKQRKLRGWSRIMRWRYAPETLRWVVGSHSEFGARQKASIVQTECRFGSIERMERIAEAEIGDLPNLDRLFHPGSK